MIAVLATAVWAYVWFVYATTDEIAANLPIVWQGIAAVFIVGALIYAVSYVVNRRRGVLITQTFRELPPE